MPQIELMMADLPHTLYVHKKKVKKEDIDESTRLMLEAAERKKRREAEGFSIQDVFSGKADMDAQEEENN